MSINDAVFIRAVEEIKSVMNPTASFYDLKKPKLIVFPEVSDAGFTGGTHPSVVYTPTFFANYKYWMAYTPYPNVRFENPCIVASNDGINWIKPTGLTNPIEPAPALPRYNSDTELLFVSSDKLRCYWREFNGGDAGLSLLKFKESTNGVDWTASTTCTISNNQDPLSPCIIKSNDIWYMWVGSTIETDTKLTRFESVDGINWVNPVVCTTNYDDFAFNWHPMVWSTITGYHSISAIKNLNRQSGIARSTDLYYGKSKDGIVWSFDENPVFMRADESLKSFRVYRSCAVQDSPSNYKLYISGLGGESEQIHVLDAKKIAELA